MKRVLHINSNKIWRGGEQQIHYLMNTFSTKYDMYLFCPENSELYIKNSSSKKDKLFTYKKRFGFDVFAAFKLKNISKENQIDLIHLHDSHAINTYLIAVFFGMNIPCIIHRRVNFTITNKWKYKHKNIRKIICLSEEVKKNLSVFIDDKKLAVINPGIDIRRFENNNHALAINQLKQELNLSNETKLIGIVSALEKEKNIEEFITIANKLTDKYNNYHFVIIGDGSLKSQFTNLNSKIHLLGFRNDIPQLLSGLDIFLFTSKSEGYGQVLLEAMAAKVPVISNNFSAVNEIIKHNKTGLIYNSVDDAVNHIESLIKDDQVRNTITENAFRFVQQFDVTLMNKKIENIYESVFNNE